MAIAVRDKTETRVNKMTTQLMKRQPWKEVLTRPSTNTASGMATQPTMKSATARETIRLKVGCLMLFEVHSAKITIIFPRQQLTAMRPSKSV